MLTPRPHHAILSYSYRTRSLKELELCNHGAIATQAGNMDGSRLERYRVDQYKQRPETIWYDITEDVRKIQRRV